MGELKLTRTEKKEIADKHRVYLDLLSNIGGALDLNKFEILLNKKYEKEIASKNNKMKAFNYSKIYRDIRELEKTGYITRYKVVTEHELGGRPLNKDRVVLSSKGWYVLQKSTRGEVKCESDITMSMINFKAYKNIILREEVEKSNNLKKRLIQSYKDHQQNIVSKYNHYIDVERIINNKRIIISNIDSMVEYYYNIEIKYVVQNLKVNDLLEALDELLGVLELMVDMDKREVAEERDEPPQLRIKLDCISKNQIRIKKFILRKDKYTRKYAFYDYIYKGRTPKTFKNKFKNVYQYVKFYTLKDDYSIELY